MSACMGTNSAPLPLSFLQHTLSGHIRTDAGMTQDGVSVIHSHCMISKTLRHLFIGNTLRDDDPRRMVLDSPKLAGLLELLPQEFRLRDFDGNPIKQVLHGHSFTLFPPPSASPQYDCKNPKVLQKY